MIGWEIFVVLVKVFREVKRDDKERWGVDVLLLGIMVIGKYDGSRWYTFLLVFIFFKVS